MATDKDPLPPIKFAALAEALLHMADTLVPAWLPGGVLRKPEYVCGSLAGGKGTSCSVNLVKGLWSDFSTGETGGDLVSLYAAIHGMTMGKAAVELAREYGLEDVAGVVTTGHEGHAPRPAPPPPVAPPPPTAPPPRTDEGWCTAMPVPENAPAPTFRHYHRAAADIVHTAAYRSDGFVLGYVVRFKTSDGGKETLPYTWCTSARDGGSKWHWRTWDEPRPLYYPGGVSPGSFYSAGKPMPTIVLVEGEKKADMLQALLHAHAPHVYLVVSWPGGCKAWKKALWEWLAGCTVLLWPDCDGKRKKLTNAERKECLDDLAIAAAEAMKPLLPEHEQPGMAAMLAIGALLRDEQMCKVQLLQIPKPLEVPDGWDCADAIATDGWDGERVLAFFGQAQPLPEDAGKNTPAGGAGAPAGGAGGRGGGSGGGGGAKKIDGPGEPGDGDLPWWLKPYWNAEKQRWLVSRKLVIAALLNDERLTGVLALNELTNNVDARHDWPWINGKAGPVKRKAALLLGKYLSDSFGLPAVPVMTLEEAIETVAFTNSFHPVREYLQTLKWDGIRRREKWLLHAIGESPQTLPAQMVEYLGLVGRFLLGGMVHRVIDPGCKFDYCVVLEGEGGLRKSTLVKTLASKAFFSGAHFDLQRGKDGQEQVQGIWVYELQELSNFGKADLNLIKAFISNEDDRYRPSYGRVVESYPRQCVMVGTTNEQQYLRDRTGNRRWWPVPVRKRINIDWVEKWRDQLLAEAYADMLAGEDYVPTPDQEERLFKPMQDSRMEETPLHGELMWMLTRFGDAFAKEGAINHLTDFVTNAQIVKALGVDIGKNSTILGREVGSWMRSQGWKTVKRSPVPGAARVNYYARPKGWPQDDAGPLIEWTDSKAEVQTPAVPNSVAQPLPNNSTEQHRGDDDAPF